MERKLIAAAVSSALALPMTAQAVEFAVSGHVNRAVISVDGQGNDNDLTHVDSNASETRFRFKGSEDIGSGMTAGVLLEIGRPGAWRTRHAAVDLSGAFGKLTLGKTSAAADGMAHAWLGGLSWLGGVTNWCSYHSTGPACPSNDGGRIDVLRYDTPAIGPATLSVSAGNKEYWDAKLSVAGSFGDAGYDVRIGHIFENDQSVPATVKQSTMGDEVIHTVVVPAVPAPTGDITTASAAVAFGQGTSIMLAWSQEGIKDETEYTFVALDHMYSDDGSIGVYWKSAETNAPTNGDGSLWGVGAAHTLGGGATAYAGYRMMKEDGKEDVSFIIAGLRVTFD